MSDQQFDIFEFLKISQREDVLHTPMLAGLLDPFAGHGFDDLFLRKFIALVGAVENDHRWSACEWIVKQQQRVPGGRVDILLLCPKSRTAIAVETKIGASESKSQLPSYRDWLVSLAPHFTNHRLILLNLRGTASRVLPKDSIPIGFASVLTILCECLAARSTAEFAPAIRLYAAILARLVGLKPPDFSRSHVQEHGLSNLFRFLRISRREAVLHTRMLAGLLDPAASHNQGVRFLRPFLDLVLGPDFTAQCVNSTWAVDPEPKIPQGCLDIRLSCTEKKILIAVENKIDASEGERQIERYAQWMDTQYVEYPTRVLVFLTVEGVAPLTGIGREVRLLSYKQVLAVFESAAADLKPSPFTFILNDYLDVVRGIVPEQAAQGEAPMRSGQKRLPSPSHVSAVLNFLRDLVRRWGELPVGGGMRPMILQSLVPRLTLDSESNGKYSGVDVWHHELLQFTSHQVIVIRVEVTLTNRRVMGLWVGLHWQNTRAFDTNARWLQLPEAVELTELLSKFYSVQQPQRVGQWIGVAERVEYPRSDGALVAVLRHHAPDIQRTLISMICNICTLCGDKLLALNRRLVTLQRR